MITKINFSNDLHATVNGGEIIAFNYTRRLNELCGSWSAQVAEGTFSAGDDISFTNAMNNGIISKAHKDSSGLWHIEGYDAGIRLMRSTPDIETLPKGSARNVIQFLATSCGITLDMSSEGLEGFNVRSLISGSTCAEAILELTMFSGLIVFINKNGVLCVKSSSDNPPPLFQNVIDDSGTDFDLDGYATNITVILRKSSVQEDEETSEPSEHYTGETPSTSPDRKTYAGSFSNGSYSFTMLEPFGVIEKLTTTITENGVTIETEEEHDYDYEHQIIWRDNQEYVLFAFIETGYTLTKTVTGTYSGDISFSEVTTETMTRSLSSSDAIGIPVDWEGKLNFVDSETITRSTVRTGAPDPTADMPAYAPPFDSQLTRTYSRGLRGKNLVCNETEKRYEARQVGTISPVNVGGEPVPHFLLNSNLAIQTHSTPQWVEVNTYRTYCEQYDNDGNCVLSTRSEYSDDGSKWLAEHSLSDTGDNELNEYQKAYAKFSQASQGLEVSLGSSVLASAWNFVELQGRMKSTTDDENGLVLGDVNKWYDNGAYIPSEICPHYNEYTRSCNVAHVEQSQQDNCVQGFRGMYYPRWMSCQRALRILDYVKQNEEKQIDAPIIGTASLSGSSQQSPTVGYKREIYINDDIPDAQAQTIANTIASNILKVKGTKGLRKTVTIPYKDNLELDGAIVEISHDWENLTSSVTYRTSGNIPEFLIAQSVSGIAAFVSARENSKLSVPKYGVVSALDDKFITVNTDNHSVKCTTKLKNLSVGDNVLVSFPSGNKFRGQVIARL